VDNDTRVFSSLLITEGRFHHLNYYCCENFKFYFTLSSLQEFLSMSREQNAGRNHNVKINNSTFEKRVEEFKYLGTILIHQNSIPEEIKSRLRSGNACFHSVQNLLYSRLLSKNSKITIQGGSNMTGTDLCVNKPQSVGVIFEPPCI